MYSEEGSCPDCGLQADLHRERALVSADLDLQVSLCTGLLHTLGVESVRELHGAFPFPDDPA